MRRIASVVLVLCLAVGGFACGSDEDPSVEVPTGGGNQSTTTTTGGTTTVRVEDEPMTAAPFEAKAVTIEAEGQGLLTEVRHAAHDDFYRVVFEFKGDVPGVKVGFTERPVVQDGSGDEVSVGGDDVLLVQFEPASGFDMEAGVESYTGPKRIEVEQDPVVEVVRVSDFEARLDWAIGVDADTGFRVMTLDGPGRVVIDLQPIADA